MKHSTALALWAAAIGLLLVGIAAMQSNGATDHPLLVDATKAQLAQQPSVMMCSPYGVKLPHPKFPVTEEHGT